MGVLDDKIPRWKQAYYRFKALRNVPFRKQFFVGYDLHGNTYWEFKLESNTAKLRRKLVPTKRQDFIVDYFQTIPPMWHQWLRYTRHDPPSLAELLEDQDRLKTLKHNSKIIDQNWKNLSLHNEQLHHVELQKELQKLDKAHKSTG